MFSGTATPRSTYMSRSNIGPGYSQASLSQASYASKQPRSHLPSTASNVPSQRGYPSQSGYPPPSAPSVSSQSGGYPSQSGGYPPPSQSGGYPPPSQSGGYPPPKAGDYPPPRGGSSSRAPPPSGVHSGYVPPAMAGVQRPQPQYPRPQ